MATEEVVYLEDLVAGTAPTSKPSDNTDANPSSQASASSTGSNTTAARGAENGKPAATNALKRQRTLVDMFSAAPATQSSKKLKLEKSGGSAGSIKASVTTSSLSAVVSGSQPLNSIPFSLSAYQESLSEEERQLLGLECESMGKSW